MPDIPLTLLTHFSLLLGATLILRLCGRHTALKPLALGLGIVVVYWTVSPAGLYLQGQLPVLSDLHWNWLGKVFAIVAAILYWKVSCLSGKDIGFTMKQHAGSVPPALVMMVLLCAFSWGHEAMSADGTDLSTERLLFQVLMPGLNEELIFRGLLLAFFCQAFGEGRKLAGGTFGDAAIATTLLFAAGHSLFIVKNALHFNTQSMVITCVLGAGLLWLRTRTGSLLLPIIAHNLINVGNSFF